MTRMTPNELAAKLTAYAATDAPVAAPGGIAIDREDCAPAAFAALRDVIDAVRLTEDVCAPGGVIATLPTCVLRQILTTALKREHHKLFRWGP
jgi:hypothetical protein